MVAFQTASERINYTESRMVSQLYSYHMLDGLTSVIGKALLVPAP